MKYYLIGLPGSGKSTIGRELAHELKYKFIDTDKLIEGKYGSISNIFKEHGEAYFRDVESEILKSLMCLDNVVISWVEELLKEKLIKAI